MSTHYLVLDFESFYSKEYSLRRMTPVEYLLDNRFECTGCAVIEGINPNLKAIWYDPEPFVLLLKRYRALQEQGHKIVVISHNALFDVCLLRWRFGFLPDLCIDTMGMARALIQAFTRGVSLKLCAQYLGLPEKGDAILKVEGMTAAMIKQAGLWDAYTAYACNDAEICRDIFLKLKPDFPAQEYLVMDMVIRMAVSPRFKLNSTKLAEYHHQVVQAKEQLLQRCGLSSRDALMSNDKFAEVLRSLGVEPETKISPTTGKEAYAFAKTDQFMADLEEHDDPDVQALAAARLGVKTTIEETRSKRFLDISLLTWPGNLGTGWLPVPLRYGGAHTHRLSGDWKMNLQNLARGGLLRDAIEAPPGFTVVTCDASQIEARMTAWLCGQDDLVEDFRNGVDIYSKFAEEEVYHYPISKKTHPDERFTGKTATLGLGFGMGAPKFHTIIKVQSRLQLGKELDPGVGGANTIVQAYRRRYSKIPAGWEYFKQMFPLLAREDSRIEWGPITFRHQYIEGPTGLKLFYHNLRWESVDGRGAWICDYNGRKKFLHGGKMMENVIQHLARCFIFEVALSMRKDYPQFPLAHQVHDELVYVVPSAIAAEFKARLLHHMNQAPGWAPGLPVTGEAGEGASYGSAK